LLSELEEKPRQMVLESDLQIFEAIRGKRTRLWYITGCHIRQETESRLSKKALNELMFLYTASSLEDLQFLHSSFWCDNAGHFSNRPLRFSRSLKTVQFMRLGMYLVLAVIRLI
jgi:hypothetical protein